MLLILPFMPRCQDGGVYSARVFTVIPIAAYYAVVSVLAYVIYAIDKKAAIKHRRRVSEKSLHLLVPQMDVIIEVLDARIPYSSENPMVATLREGKPVIKILNKADLADPKMTQTWKDYFEQENGVKAIAFGNDKAARSEEPHV